MRRASSGSSTVPAEARRSSDLTRRPTLGKPISNVVSAMPMGVGSKACPRHGSRWRSQVAGKGITSAPPATEGESVNQSRISSDQDIRQHGRSRTDPLLAIVSTLVARSCSAQLWFLEGFSGRGFKPPLFGQHTPSERDLPWAEASLACSPLVDPGGGLFV